LLYFWKFTDNVITEYTGKYYEKNDDVIITMVLIDSNVNLDGYKISWVENNYYDKIRYLL